MEIKPTNGRMILFVANGFEGSAMQHFAVRGEQPCSASVAFVHNDRKVNLTVSDHAGQPHHFEDIVLRQPDDDIPPMGTPYAEWMPFQKGQASKTDEITPRIGALEEGLAELEGKVSSVDGRLTRIEQSAVGTPPPPAGG